MSVHVEDTPDGCLPNQDQIQLVPVFRARTSPGHLRRGLVPRKEPAICRPQRGQSGSSLSILTPPHPFHTAQGKWAINHCLHSLPRQSHSAGQPTPHLECSPGLIQCLQNWSLVYGPADKGRAHTLIRVTGSSALLRRKARSFSGHHTQSNPVQQAAPNTEANPMPSEPTGAYTLIEEGVAPLPQHAQAS